MTTTNQKPTLLFVDDEERIVNLLRMMFRGEYQVLTATSGKEALEILAKHRVEVLVSDQRMPGMLGVELLAEARKRSPATMRILLTGYSDLAAIVGSVNDGEVFRFVNKPWNHDEIKTIIRAAAEAALATDVSAVQTETTTAAQASDAADGPELLIVDDDAADREAIRALFNKDLKTHCAASVGEALALLETRNIGVIVAEARVGSQDTGPLLRALKQQYPSITTVMLTKAADSDLVVKLINQVQIFRFATKPIRTGALQLAVSAAMKEHKRFRASPTLLKRYSVAPSRELEDATLAASVLKSLSGLRSRLSRILH
ncbi:MAG TPA: response regulator [Burkholderiaceae bacterium]